MTVLHPSPIRRALADRAVRAKLTISSAATVVALGVTIVASASTDLVALLASALVAVGAFAAIFSTMIFPSSELARATVRVPAISTALGLLSVYCSAIALASTYFLVA